MKLRYIVGLIVIVAFAVLAILSSGDSKIDYADFSSAKNLDKTVQVIGQWVKTKPADFDPELNTFTFHMHDKEGNETKVVHNGAKPNNFDIADEVVVKGKFVNGVFESSEILTKCPSKYESDGEGINDNAKHPESIDRKTNI